MSEPASNIVTMPRGQRAPLVARIEFKIESLAQVGAALTNIAVAAELAQRTLDRSATHGEPEALRGVAQIFQALNKLLHPDCHGGG